MMVRRPGDDNFRATCFEQIPEKGGRLSGEGGRDERLREGQGEDGVFYIS